MAFSATPEDALKSARTYLARGDRSMALAGQADTPLQRVRAMQRAKPSYKWAIRKAMDGLGKADADVRASLEQARVKATRALLSILNAETAFYHVNGTANLATLRNGEALELAPQDPEANRLQKALTSPPPVTTSVRVKAPQQRSVALADLNDRYCTWTRWRSARFWRHGDTRFLTRPPARVAPVRRAPFKSAPRAASGRGFSAAASVARR